jgi:DNA-binding MarR family transcriptional regulator
LNPDSAANYIYDGIIQNVEVKMTDVRLIATRLSALALAVADVQRRHTPTELVRSPHDAALLNSIVQTPGLMTEELTEILGLTHSGTVRAIDRLVGGGFAERRTHARDRRAVGLHPTDAGTNLVREMQHGIHAALCAMLDGLEDGQRDAVASAVDLLVSGLVCDRRTSDRICRMCDEQICRPETCPAEQFARI